MKRVALVAVLLAVGVAAAIWGISKTFTPGEVTRLEPPYVDEGPPAPPPKPAEPRRPTALAEARRRATPGRSAAADRRATAPRASAAARRLRRAGGADSTPRIRVTCGEAAAAGVALRNVRRPAGCSGLQCQRSGRGSARRVCIPSSLAGCRFGRRRRRDRLRRSDHQRGRPGPAGEGARIAGNTRRVDGDHDESERGEVVALSAGAQRRPRREVSSGPSGLASLTPQSTVALAVASDRFGGMSVAILSGSDHAPSEPACASGVRRRRTPPRALDSVRRQRHDDALVPECSRRRPSSDASERSIRGVAGRAADCHPP